MMLKLGVSTQPAGHAPTFSISSHFVLQEALSQIKYCLSIKNKHLPSFKFYPRPKLWTGYATEPGIFKIRFPPTTVKEMAVKHAECRPTGFPPTGQG